MARSAITCSGRFRIRMAPKLPRWKPRAVSPTVTSRTRSRYSDQVSASQPWGVRERSASVSGYRCAVSAKALQSVLPSIAWSIACRSARMSRPICSSLAPLPASRNEFRHGHGVVVQLVLPTAQRVVLVGEPGGKQVEVEGTPEHPADAAGQCRFAGHAIPRRYVHTSVGRAGVEHEGVRTVCTHVAVRPVQHLEPAVRRNARQAGNGGGERSARGWNAEWAVERMCEDDPVELAPAIVVQVG